MKKIIFLLIAIAFSLHANATKITVYGKNRGSNTTTTTTTNPDGSTTTTTIDCDSFFEETCYVVETSSVIGGDKLTIGEGSVLIMTGTLVSHNLSTRTVVFNVD